MTKRISGSNRAGYRRASTLLGLLPLAVLLAVGCAIVLDRSLETAQSSAMLAWRLQARAAAEGVAVILARDPENIPAPQVLGAAIVTCRNAFAAGDATIVPMDVGIQPPGGNQVRYRADYRAVFVREADRWRLVRLEE